MSPLPEKVWEALVRLQQACAEQALTLDTVLIARHGAKVRIATFNTSIGPVVVGYPESP